MSDQPATPRFEEALARRDELQYVLRLYVVGATSASRRAIANLVRFAESELAGRHALEVIDIQQQPELAPTEQIIVAPTLVRLEPLPTVRIVGDMSDMVALRRALDLPEPEVVRGG